MFQCTVLDIRILPVCLLRLYTSIYWSCHSNYPSGSAMIIFFSVLIFHIVLLWLCYTLFLPLQLYTRFYYNHIVSKLLWSFELSPHVCYMLMHIDPENWVLFPFLLWSHAMHIDPVNWVFFPFPMCVCDLLDSYSCYMQSVVLEYNSCLICTIPHCFCIVSSSC